MQSNDKRTMNAEDLYRFQIISGARLAPDGENIVFSVQRVDQKTEKKYSNYGWSMSLMKP
jgi:hypothetical protein